MTDATGPGAGPGGADRAGAAGRPGGTGRVVAVYTLGRIAVFLAMTAVLFGVGAALVTLTGHRVDRAAIEPLMLAAAFVAAPLSMLASYVLLARQRQVITTGVAGWLDRRRARAAARTAAEDAYAERLIREQQERRDAPAGPPES